jgi:ABC-type hemin transport system substrate-binding protein
LVPSVTECLFAVGAGDAVVACTKYCTDPADRVAALPKVGGTKTPDVDAIVALEPDLIVMNAEENRRADFDALAASGVAIFVTEPKTVAASIDLIVRLSAAVGYADAGAKLAADQGAGVARAIAARGDRPAVRYFCPIWKKPWMAFNADTYAHDVLRVAGGENIMAAAPDRYPHVTLAEIVLLPDEPYPFAERDLSDLEPLAGTPALRDEWVHLVDGKALAWFGPRTGEGVAYFAALFARAR